MRLLLDTQLVIWSAMGRSLLPNRASDLLGSAENELYVSVISIWEIAIKQGLRRAGFNADARFIQDGLAEHGFGQVPLTGEHAIRVLSLPPIHGDPFDRILVAQALSEGMTLVTADTVVARYPGAILQV